MKIPRGFSHPVKIGAGSFSTVLRVREVKLDRPVALKIMTPKGRRAIESVEKEARLLASISSPRVPRIYDVRRNAASVIMVMEWIDGVPLSAFVETTLSPDIRLSIAADLIKALTQLQSHGIVHRDIKPENIMLTPDRGVVFVDFGFSGLASASGGPTIAPSLKGTPRYMAPELWTKLDNVDYVKSDLYSMGVVLRELCAQNLPQCAEELLHSDPSKRPDSCAAFAPKWDECCEAGDETLARGAIAGAASGYTSRLLYEGARDLYGAGRRAEAYALLTESLDRWPDNSDAVAMLHNRFSLPLQAGSIRKIAAWASGVLLLLLALTGAFIYGRQSQLPIITESESVFANGEVRRLSQTHRAEKVAPIPVPITLRELPGSAGPFGTVAIIVPRRAGVLLVDGQLFRNTHENRFTVSLDPGAHRLEWYDSTGRRSYGESVDVLPFATRTVSFERFSHERR